MKQETLEEVLKKIKSIKLCLMAHPNNEVDSEFADRITDLEEIQIELEKQQGYSEEEVLDILDIILSEYKDSLKNKTDFYPALRFEQFKKK
jgi:hypothetical protein